jgi:hypothetical protein
VDETEAKRQAAAEELARRSAELLATTRSERDARAAVGGDTRWFDRFLAEFGHVAEQAAELEVVHVIAAAVHRHGPGPWPPADLAAIIGRDPVVVRRVLEQMADDGYVERPTSERPHVHGEHSLSDMTGDRGWRRLDDCSPQEIAEAWANAEAAYHNDATRQWKNLTGQRRDALVNICYRMTGDLMLDDPELLLPDDDDVERPGSES